MFRQKQKSVDNVQRRGEFDSQLLVSEEEEDFFWLCPYMVVCFVLLCMRSALGACTVFKLELFPARALWPNSLENME